MPLIRLTALLVTTLLLAACAPRMAELPQPPQRLTQYGYSLMPPDEPGWKVGGRDGQHLILGRIGKSRDETVIIMAGNTAIPHFKDRDEFSAYVRQKAHSDNTPGGRYAIQQEEMSELRHDGADCVRIHMVSLDHQAKRRSGGRGEMVLEVPQLTCRHPFDDGTATTIGYSQRAYPDKRDPQFMHKADQLIDSLRFSKF